MTDLERLAAEIKSLSFRAKLGLAQELYGHGRYELAEQVVRMAYDQLRLENALRPLPGRKP